MNLLYKLDYDHNHQWNSSWANHIFQHILYLIPFLLIRSFIYMFRSSSFSLCPFSFPFVFSHKDYIFLAEEMVAIEINRRGLGKFWFCVKCRNADVKNKYRGCLPIMLKTHPRNHWFMWLNSNKWRSCSIYLIGLWNLNLYEMKVLVFLSDSSAFLRVTFLAFLATAVAKVWVQFQNYMEFPFLILLLLMRKWLGWVLFLRGNSSIFHLLLPQECRRR